MSFIAFIILSVEVKLLGFMIRKKRESQSKLIEKFNLIILGYRAEFEYVEFLVIIGQQLIKIIDLTLDGEKFLKSIILFLLLGGYSEFLRKS